MSALEILPGGRFAFTGVVGVELIAARVRRLGAIVDQAVSRDTCALVVGPEPGSRLFKAHALGIRVVTEAQFLVALAAAEVVRDDTPIAVLGDGGEVQARCTFSEWAIDNGDGFDLQDLQDIAARLRRDGEVKLNLGAGGTFILRRDVQNPEEAVTL